MCGIDTTYGLCQSSAGYMSIDPPSMAPIRILNAIDVPHALEAAPCGLIIADAGSRILWANQQIHAIFAYSSGELVGQPLASLVFDSQVESGQTAGDQAGQPGAATA